MALDPIAKQDAMDPEPIQPGFLDRDEWKGLAGPELMDALAAFADKRDRSRSLVAEAAIASFLSSDADERREAAVAKRLDRIERRFVQMERDGNIVIEMLALFVRSWLLNTPPVPESEKSAVRAQAADRYDAFVSALGRRLAMGPLVRDEVRQNADS